MCRLNKIMLVLTAGVTLMLLLLEVKGQSTPGKAVTVTSNKTTTIVFPDIIESVDRGSNSLLAQKAKGLENVLFVKAGRPNFPETNLTVITSDGKIHHFFVSFSDNPVEMIQYVDPPTSETNGAGVVIFRTAMTETQLREVAADIYKTRPRIHFKRNVKAKMQLSLSGIYIKDNHVFYQFRIRNNSNIDYDVDLVRFYIHDVQHLRRTASQEIDVKPLFIYGNDGTIKGRSHEDLIYALDKFTIPDAKRLRMEIFERNGGRHLQLEISNRRIIGAKLIK